MPAGTIALTNNSTAVTGTGTSFTTELKANDFVVAVVGGVAYTLGIKSVDSNTALTLAQAYTGPAASGLAWTPVPFGTMTAITAQLAAQVTYAVRGFNLDKANWQGIFTGTGNVTVNLPDGTSWSGPAWNAITESLNNKANTTDVLSKNGNLIEVADKAAGRANLGVSYGSAAGTVAAGDDSRLRTIDGKSGGTLSSSINFSGAKGYKISSQATSTEVVNGESRNYLYYSANSAGGVVLHYQFSLPGQYTSAVFSVDTSIFQLRSNGIGYSPGGWQTYSDKRLKDNIIVIDKPIERLFKMRGYTFEKFGIAGTGIIAQEAKDAITQAVSVSGDMKRPDNGKMIKDALSISPGDLVGLLIEVCRNQDERIQNQGNIISDLQLRMKSIDGLDA